MMAEGPTTLNGPLHTDEASLTDRQITAFFATRAEAETTRDALQAEGVGPDRIMIDAATTEAAKLEPTEGNLLGRIREALMPEDSQRATRAAIDGGEVVLRVIPGDGDVDRIVRVIQSGTPSHFDADLERWRNSAPS